MYWVVEIDVESTGWVVGVKPYQMPKGVEHSAKPGITASRRRR